VAGLYEAYRHGEASPLPELALQYADFAVWQRQWLESGVLAEQMGYWRQQLGGELPPLQIATARVRELGGSQHGAGEHLMLSAELSEQLKSLSRREGVTLFMLLLAAWQTLLYRYTGHTDVVVGTDVANRTRLETEGLIGFFVNQLVLRTDLSGDPSFRELLARVRTVCLGAYAHQDVPFEKLVEELQPHRQLSRSPLFQVKFVLQNMPSETLELSNLKLSTIAREGGNAKLDLSFLISDRADGISGTLEYSRDLFDAETISRMLGHYQTLLHSIVANPEARLKRLDLLTHAEKEQQALNEMQQEELALKKLIVARRRVVSLQN
jgi:non-ribosomal peptide synthetase component F